jgi:phosphoribosyl 1,2-cyclic phosphodiesterase/CheY-like chemotaxis protein
MKKVLIVDDDPSILKIASMRLRAEAVEILTAGDGAEGLRLIREHRPAVVVLDLMMPKMHGFTVLQQIRGDPLLRSIKVLVTSAKGYASDIEQIRRQGADRYLRKPYDLQEFWEAVAELLGERKARFLVRFWGTRGSIATPGPATVKYGGNTACTEIRCGDHLLILDAGTGIRMLGVALLEEFEQRPIKGHIFVGHTHWDHIQGFPFFAPAFQTGNEFTIYSLRGAEKPLERIFRGQMDSDYFPVRLTDMKAQLKFTELESDVDIGGVRVSYVFLNHPGLAVGFRVRFEGRSLTYISDHETYGRLRAGESGSDSMDAEVAGFAANSDLLICEAQYTEEEYELKRGWGHSTFLDVLERTAQARAKSLAIFHHDPSHDDQFLDGMEDYCRETIQERNYGFRCFLAREGMAVEL